MPAEANAPFTLAFVGYTDPDMDQRAAAYEDEVLPLLEEHGAKVLYRGRRTADQDGALPFEVHLLWFPHRQAFDAYMADDRRQTLLAKHGEVFTLKHAVQLDTITAASALFCDPS